MANSLYLRLYDYLYIIVALEGYNISFILSSLSY